MQTICRAVVLTFAVLCGCVTHAQYFAEKVYELDAQSLHTSDNHLLLLLVDGLPAETFQRFLNEGKLPAMKTHLIERGVHVKHVMSAVPAIAPVNVSVLLTSAGLSHHALPTQNDFNIVDTPLRRFDERRWIFHIQEHLTVPSLVDYAQPNYTTSTFSALGKGSEYWVQDKLDTGLAFSVENWYRLDAQTLDQAGSVLRVQGKFKRVPQLVVAHLVGLGGEPQQKESSYAEYLQWLDAEFGKLVQSLQDVGIYDEVSILLTSTQGRAPSKRAENVDLFLHQLLNDHTPSRCTREECYRPGKRVDDEWVVDTYDVAKVPFGDRSQMLYFRSRDEAYVQRLHRIQEKRDPLTQVHLRKYTNHVGKTVDIIKSLTSLESVGLLFYRGRETHTYVVTSREGEGLISQTTRAGKRHYAYRVIKGQDPLQYELDARIAAFMARDFHAERDWLEATKNTAYPGIVSAIPELFANERMGDLFMVAQTGYGFTKRAYGFGGLNRKDRLLPLVLAGPHISPRTLDMIAMADVLPMLLHYLGYADEEALAGKVWCPFSQTCRFEATEVSLNR